MKKGTLLYWQDGNFFVGRLRERPDVFSQGRTMEELESNIRDALHMMEEADADGLPINYEAREIVLEA